VKLIDLFEWEYNMIKWLALLNMVMNSGSVSGRAV
jgi:hypothetical protein